MSILLYCVTEKDGLPDVGSGVAGLPVLRWEHENLTLLFSRSNSAESWTGSPLKDSAWEFHHLLQRVFNTRAIIPFRFPTLMRDESELDAHLHENAAEYRSQLKRFSNLVQMDISIAHTDPADAGNTFPSGAEYLRSRQQRSEQLETVARDLQACAGRTTRGWRMLPAQRQVKLFALLERGSVAAFKGSLSGTPVPAAVAVRVTGPWPVTEFLELKLS